VDRLDQEPQPVAVSSDANDDESWGDDADLWDE
jgi:hypothetical protein